MDRTPKIRPELNLSGTSEAEEFQNTVLRPVLKLQHELLLRLIDEYAAQFKLDVYRGTKETVLEEVTNLVQKQRSVKATLLGTVIGQFSTSELEVYLAGRKEYDKRIQQMILQRFRDSL